MAHIIETLQGIRRGRFVELCSQQLTSLVKAVAEHEKGGKLTIVLSLVPQGEGQITLKPQVKLTSPNPDVGEAIFYVTEDGELERTDPRQGDFDEHWDNVRGSGKDRAAKD